MNKYEKRALIENTPFLQTFISTSIEGKKRPSIRFYRWLCIIAVNALFFLSYHIDFQVLEGTLSGSRFFGFHLTDPFISLQMFFAHHSLHINLIIGTLTIVIFYLIAGGRAFCAWICPYGLLSEIFEKIHRDLVKKGVIKSRLLNPKIRYVFWVFFLFLAFFAGYLVYEIINPVGILSRAVVYGASGALGIVLFLALAEIFLVQRFWCGYVCPIGTTYSLLGWISLTKVRWSDKCDHCNVCSKVCIAPHILEAVKDKTGKAEMSIMSGECTLCGRCIEVCHTDALSFETKLKKLI